MNVLLYFGTNNISFFYEADVRARVHTFYNLLKIPHFRFMTNLGSYCQQHMGIAGKDFWNPNPCQPRFMEFKNVFQRARCFIRNFSIGSNIRIVLQPNCDWLGTFHAEIRMCLQRCIIQGVSKKRKPRNILKFILF